MWTLSSKSQMNPHIGPILRLTRKGSPRHVLVLVVGNDPAGTLQFDFYESALV